MSTSGSCGGCNREAKLDGSTSRHVVEGEAWRLSHLMRAGVRGCGCGQRAPRLNELDCSGVCAMARQRSIHGQSAERLWSHQCGGGLITEIGGLDPDFRESFRAGKLKDRLELAAPAARGPPDQTGQRAGPSVAGGGLRRNQRDDM